MAGSIEDLGEDVVLLHTPTMPRWLLHVPTTGTGTPVAVRRGTGICIVGHAARAWRLLVLPPMRHLFVIAIVAACGHDAAEGTTPDATPDAPGCAMPAAGPATERVVTTSGTVHGVSVGASWKYLGVPFAAPPTGPLRFAAPAPATCATTEIDASAFGPQCPQLDANGNYLGDEDCLHVNVWAPAATAAPRPVMVWIHGGANAIGFTSDPLYDGQKLAETGDVIVVTADYRLGQLGFVDHVALEAESPAAGNYGLLDQIAALQWVHDNIAGFGGDPANVTVFGESAGGRDTCSIVAAPAAAGLFQRSIIESGACGGLPTRAVAETQGNTFATAAGCTTGDIASCLRALTAEAVVRAAAPDPSILVSTPYQPVIDGTIQPVLPVTALANGSFNHVPFMVGSNAQETGGAVPAVPDEATYAKLLTDEFGATLETKIIAQYPVSRFGTPRAAYVRVTTDARFVCPTRTVARNATAGQTDAVYRYFFEYADSPVGAVHGLEIPFVFGTFDGILVNGVPYQPTAADLAVSAAVQADWTSFARTGTPSGTPTWPRWDATDPVRGFTATPDVEVGVRTADCDFWDSLL
jgi:para-nitrobenzyl esterase